MKTMTGMFFDYQILNDTFLIWCTRTFNEPSEAFDMTPYHTVRRFTFLFSIQIDCIDSLIQRRLEI